VSAFTWAPSPCCTESSACVAVDDPPPEPVDCPFCSGNAQLHRTRMQALESFCSRAALLCLP
jgi:hypothetical protein